MIVLIQGDGVAMVDVVGIQAKRKIEYPTLRVPLWQEVFNGQSMTTNGTAYALFTR